MLSIIFSNEVAVDKYRNDLIISIRVYTAGNKVSIPVEDWSTLRSNISIIYGEDLKGLISSYSQGHLQQNECKISANMRALFYANAIYKACSRQNNWQVKGKWPTIGDVYWVKYTIQAEQLIDF